MYEITVIPMIHFFRHPVSDTALPRQFNNPFHYTPHILCIEAAKEVQNYLSLMDLWKRKPEEGKMFGVLVVRTPDGKTGFLAAFSGILDGNYLHPYFVPPVYNLQQPDSFFRQEEKQISAINRQIRLLENNPAYLQAQQDLIEKNTGQSLPVHSQTSVKSSQSSPRFTTQSKSGLPQCIRPEP